jgi:hypothetical protein
MRVTSWAAIMQPFGDVLTFEQFCAIRERLFELKGMIESIQNVPVADGTYVGSRICLCARFVCGIHLLLALK